MTFDSPATWRLLTTSPADGATNMAIDEAILHALADGIGRPTLRFYQWDPPCLSLGYNQPYAEVDAAECDRLGYTWVRRPTGGRAILHTDELTYSIIAFADEPRVAGGIVDSYRRVSLGLLAGLSALGANVFQAQIEKVDNPHQGAVCFDTPSHYEITVNDKKLVGSAQVRRRGIVLQHGTLPLTGDLSRIFDCLKKPEPHSAGSNSRQPDHSQTALVPDKNQVETSEQAHDWRDWLLSRACTLQQALGREVPFHEVANALAQGFARALDLRLEPGELTDHERSLVQRLRREQYANDSWNRRI